MRWDYSTRRSFAAGLAPSKDANIYQNFVKATSKKEEETLVTE